MNVCAAFLYTTSAAWHGVNAYFFCTRSSAFIKTYRLTDERSEALASDVISWQGGLHVVLGAFSFLSAFRVFSIPKLDMQVPLLLGSVSLSQAVLIKPGDRWRPELSWLTIINGGLAFSHLLLAFFAYRASSTNMVLDVLNGVQKMIN